LPRFRATRVSIRRSGDSPTTPLARLRTQGLVCRLAWLGLLLLSYSVLTLWLLWPYPARAGRVVIDLGDTIHQLWTLRWTQHALFHHPANLFAANINYPYDAALALNQPTYTNALLTAPVYALTHNPVLTYNAGVLLSFILAGTFTALLVHELTDSHWAALAAGLLYAFAPVRQAHIYHLNLLSGYWMPLALWGLHRLWRDQRRLYGHDISFPDPRPDTTDDGTEPPLAVGQQYPSRMRAGALVLLIGLALGAQVLAEFYHAFYLALAVGLFLLWQLVTHRWGRARPRALLSAAAVLLGVSIALPVLLPTARAWRALDLHRSIDEHDAYSARLENYLVTDRARQLDDSLWHFNHHSPTSGAAEHSLYPGGLTLSLALIGLLRGRRVAPAAPLYVLIALGALYLSLGPTIRFGEEPGGLPSQPYRWLYNHLPGFQGARAPARWALLLQLALSVLAGYGVAGVVRLRSARWWPPVVGALLFALLALDFWELPLHGTEKLVQAPLPPIYRALAAQPPGAVLEYPLTNVDPLLVYRYEYFSIFHWRPLVNSGSSILPEAYIELSDVLRGFPDPRAVALLQALDVRYVVVHRYEMSDGAGWWWRVLAAQGVRVLARIPATGDALLAIDPVGAPGTGGQGGGGMQVPSHLGRSTPIAERWADTEGNTGVLFETSSPLVLDRAYLYERKRRLPVGVERSDGRVDRVDVMLPTYLLGGIAGIPWPGLPEDVVALHLASSNGDLRVPLQVPPKPDRIVAGPQMVGRPLPASVSAGTVLPCLLYGKGPLPIPGLVLSLRLVGTDGRIHAKQDRFFNNGFAPPDRWPAQGVMPVPCDLPIPADLPAGHYTFAVGLYDPETTQFVPFADPAGSVGLSWGRPITVIVNRN
jgi:hypothetical protein